MAPTTRAKGGYLGKEQPPVVLPVPVLLERVVLVVHLARLVVQALLVVVAQHRVDRADGLELLGGVLLLLFLHPIGVVLERGAVICLDNMI